MSDIVMEFRKSFTVNNISTNGGRMGSSVALSGQRHGLFPIVSKAERTSGITRYRKEFFKIKSPSDVSAQEVFVYLEYPSTAGDRFYLGLGGHTDAQAGLTAWSPVWLGCGKLDADLLGGSSTSVTLEMEGRDFQFPSGGYLHLSSNFLTSQAIDTGVNIGDSVEISGGTWQKAGSSDDIAYPRGLYLGSNLVMTAHDSAREEWLLIAENLYENEEIGSGNGSSAGPSLATLAHPTNGICRQPDRLPTVTAICGSVERTVQVAADGSCSGYCSSGELDMATGNWIADIVWSTAPDNGTGITITYRENPFVYSGNNCTVSLAQGVTPVNSYTATNTWAAGCIHLPELKPDTQDWTENSPNGSYDEISHPITLSNHCPYDQWTIQFTATGAYRVSGVYSGANLVTGQSVATNCTVVVDGQTIMTIPSTGWSGTWQSGDTITFTTNPAAVPLWLKQIVPAGTSAAADNFLSVGWQLSR